VSYTSRIPRIIAELDPRVELVAREAAELIEKGAKERVPVQTGKLRDSIHVERDDAGWMVLAGDNEVFYGHIVEHGGNRTAPRPFMVPALEQARPAVQKLIDRGLRNL